ncbi:hypothetical protein B0H14DRAFT_887308 [Mycena olivaceomarginata]|nr:hypothetical protein B0H14DRAFT_887308 [Mycena olivaceomarginata]
MRRAPQRTPGYLTVPKLRELIRWHGKEAKYPRSPRSALITSLLMIFNTPADRKTAEFMTAHPAEIYRHCSENEKSIRVSVGPFVFHLFWNRGKITIDGYSNIAENCMLSVTGEGTTHSIQWILRDETVSCEGLTDLGQSLPRALLNDNARKMFFCNVFGLDGLEVLEMCPPDGSSILELINNMSAQSDRDGRNIKPLPPLAAKNGTNCYRYSIDGHHKTIGCASNDSSAIELQLGINHWDWDDGNAVDTYTFRLKTHNHQHQAYWTYEYTPGSTKVHWNSGTVYKAIEGILDSRHQWFDAVFSFFRTRDPKSMPS